MSNITCAVKNMARNTFKKKSPRADVGPTSLSMHEIFRDCGKRHKRHSVNTRRLYDIFRHNVMNPASYWLEITTLFYWIYANHYKCAKVLSSCILNFEMSIIKCVAHYSVGAITKITIRVSKFFVISLSSIDDEWTCFSDWEDCSRIHQMCNL